MNLRSGRPSFVLPLGVLLAATAIAAAVAISTYRLAAAGAAAEARERGVLAEARGRFQRAGEERDLLARHVPRYRALQAAGFVGPGQRVNWVDALRTAAERARLPGVQYQIGAEAPMPAPPAGTAGLVHSPMAIDLQLLHEDDLLRFLRALEAQRAGLFLIESCSLERLGAATEAPRPDTNLRAECALAWITVPGPGPGPSPR